MRTGNQGDVRVDQVITQHDNAFYRFSMSKAPYTIPPPFPGLADGGGFFSGDGFNNAYAAAASLTHVFSPKVVDEVRVGWNRLHSARFQFNSGTDISGQIGFPGVPFSAGNGGLPQIYFNDVATLGSPTYLPSNEIQNTYSLSDTLTLIRGNHSVKIGGEFRPEEFTIFQPAAPRGTITFGTQFTDNPAAQGTGGSGFATLLTGQPDGGSINNINNVDYNRRVYGLFLQDDWRATPKLTINAGIRYDFFSAIKERHNAQANFNPVTGNLDIPKSSNAVLTPTFAALLVGKVNRNATDGLIRAGVHELLAAGWPGLPVPAGMGAAGGGGSVLQRGRERTVQQPEPRFQPAVLCLAELCRARAACRRTRRCRIARCRDCGRWRTDFRRTR